MLPYHTLIVNWTSLGANEVISLLNRMQLGAVSGKNQDNIKSEMYLQPEMDVAIAYGYNNIPRTRPATSPIVQPNPLNELSDLLRIEMLMTSGIPFPGSA